MKVTTQPGPNNFRSESWFTDTAEGFLNYLRKQLGAAQAIWPELKSIKITGTLKSVNDDEHDNERQT